MDTLDIALRLGTALVVGGSLGLNRDLHAKPTGIRASGRSAWSRSAPRSR